MNQPPPSRQDLAALARQAEHEVTSKTEAAARRGPRKERQGTGGLTSVAAVVSTVAAIAVWTHFLVSHAVSNDQIARDLQVLLLQARGQVDGYVQRHGELPKALPDATLSTVVEYAIEDASARPPRYTLSARIRDVRAEFRTPDSGRKP